MFFRSVVDSYRSILLIYQAGPLLWKYKPVINELVTLVFYLNRSEYWVSSAIEKSALHKETFICFVESLKHKVKRVTKVDHILV